MDLVGKSAEGEYEGERNAAGEAEGYGTMRYADGGAYVPYDPDHSEKGALLCADKAPPKRAGLFYTGGAMQIMTPNALPMFKDQELDHRKRRREERRAFKIGLATLRAHRRADGRGRRPHVQAESKL